MATAESYEVLADALTVHKDVRELRHPVTNEVTGHQMGGGRIYLEGERIPANEVSATYKQILDDPDNPSHEYLSARLRKVSDEPREDIGRRLGVPFDGYDDMEVDDIVKAMRVLPSATIQRIKQYEATKENRTEIVDYNIGFGEHPDERQNTKLEPPEQDEDKVVRNVATRNVPEEGPVEHGEGVTGTGTAGPAKPFGSKAADEKRGAARAPRARRGRRERTQEQNKENENDNS